MQTSSMFSNALQNIPKYGSFGMQIFTPSGNPGANRNREGFESQKVVATDFIFTSFYASAHLSTISFSI
jgi:hypothetical protein